MLNKRKKATA